MDPNGIESIPISPRGISRGECANQDPRRAFEGAFRFDLHLNQFGLSAFQSGREVGSNEDGTGYISGRGGPQEISNFA